jgi:hypothetical protein
MAPARLARPQEARQRVVELVWLARARRARLEGRREHQVQIECVSWFFSIGWELLSSCAQNPMAQKLA